MSPIKIEGGQRVICVRWSSDEAFNKQLFFAARQSFGTKMVIIGETKPYVEEHIDMGYAVEFIPADAELPTGDAVMIFDGSKRK